MPTPRDKITLVPWAQLTESHIPSSIMVGWSGNNSVNCFFTRGPRTSYIGSQTHVHSKRASFQVLEVGSMIDNIKTILG